jgi:hypothetical protein
MADFTIKRHDTRPSLSATLKRDGVAIDLTAATSVKLILKQQTTPFTAVTGTCTIVTPASGIIRYDWIAADTAVAGTYDCEFEINWGGGNKETVPNDKEKVVDIRADIDNA